MTHDYNKIMYRHTRRECSIYIKYIIYVIINDTAIFLQTLQILKVLKLLFIIYEETGKTGINIHNITDISLYICPCI